MTSTVVGRIMFTTGIMIFLALFSHQAFTKEVNVIEIRNSLPLKNSETSYRDIYINGGSKDGIRRGMVLPVKRRRTVESSLQKASNLEISTNVGRIKIIYVQPHVSIARVVSVTNAKSAPIIDHYSVMLGDQVSTCPIQVRKPAPVKRKPAATSAEIERAAELRNAQRIVRAAVKPAKVETYDLAPKNAIEKSDLPPIKFE